MPEPRPEVEPSQPGGAARGAGRDPASFSPPSPCSVGGAGSRAPTSGRSSTPGAIALFLLIGLALLLVPLPGRLDLYAKLALGAPAGLAAWTLISIIWTPTPAAALADAERVFAYAVIFAVGLWTTRLLGERMIGALLPVAIAGALVGIATVIAIGTGSDFNWYLHSDATLRFPIGYRNANAAFFLTCLWPLIGLADPQRLALAAAGADDRRGDPAAGADHPRPEPRLAARRGGRPACHPGLLTAPAADRGPGRVGGAPGDRGAAGAARRLPSRNGRPGGGAAAPRRGAGGGAEHRGIASSGGAGARRGLPATPSRALPGAGDLLGGRGWWRPSPCSPAEQSSSPSTGDRSASSISGSRSSARLDTRTCAARGSATAPRRSNRHDFWRVGLDETVDRPLLGGGAGSFSFVYLEHRRSGESPRDPHSLIVRVGSELGLPGLSC